MPLPRSRSGFYLLFFLPIRIQSRYLVARPQTIPKPAILEETFLHQIQFWFLSASLSTSLLLPLPPLSPASPLHRYSFPWPTALGLCHRLLRIANCELPRFAAAVATPLCATSRPLLRLAWSPSIYSRPTIFDLLAKATSSTACLDLACSSSC